ATPFQLGHHELCSVLNRFSGISWDTASAPRAGREAFQYSLATLQAKLDAAQESAIRLDRAWGRLSPEDLYLDDRIYTDVAEWWQAYKPHSQVSEAAKSVRMAYDQVAVHMREAESCLKGWIVRHLRDRYMPSPCSNTPRRQKYEGASIINEEQNQQGILIEQQSLLPFLLAARLAAKKPEQRPVFAEGLASSYDAFLRATTANDRDEYKNVLTDTDDDDDTAREVDADDWHMVQLKRSILQKGQFNESNHPKVKATVDKVFELWLAGEKVLVFNHYIATGHVLRAQISNRFAQYTLEQAASQFGVSLEEAEKELGRIGDRFYDKDSPWRKSCDEQVKNILAAYEVLNSNAGLILDVTRRYIRTPSFLVRFFSLADMSDAKMAVDNAFRQQDASGMSLYDLVNQFCEFLALRCGESERESFLAAIHNIQTGSNFGEAALTSFSDQEIEEAGNSTLLANVRLVNGATKTDSRQRLMLAFNTPFYPDVLISSSVLSEGVDLHLNCRHVIHHDLSWNPSTLEQRNGRVDRIGSKSERCAQPIKVYYPFIAATQDEKMYRVVMDRERWFNVVMGDNYKVDTKTTDALAERLPFPEVAASEIGFNLTAHK
ncbi:MAG: SWF/SNF helicase family protein, partial [Gammaproteobacteria bacterium]|nr:SWF/SNF helicase family protein [Gammaproteobacteria bacterium]